MHSSPAADVSERLFHEFDAVYERPVITAMVSRCESELDSVVPAAIPELVERLARQRLIDLDTTEQWDAASAKRRCATGS